MAEIPKWYDAGWLGKYLVAKDIVAELAPGRLSEFVERFSALHTDPSFSVKSLPQLFDQAQVESLKKVIKSLPRELLEVHELRRFGRFVVHDYPLFTEIQRSLVEIVSECVGEPVEPSYNFLCLYTRLGRCEPHLDSPYAKWTLDVCIDQSQLWPIYFGAVETWPDKCAELPTSWKNATKSEINLNVTGQMLTPGDAVVFSGSSQWHYRNAMAVQPGRQFCDLIFFISSRRERRTLFAPLTGLACSAYRSLLKYRALKTPCN